MPIVTLSTDIGQGDYVVGAIKGQIVKAVPNVSIIDISHQLVANNYLHAAYVCANAFSFYPANTIHFVIINLFEKTPDHLLITKLQDQYIVCPDNGILTMIAGEKPVNIFAVRINKKNISGVLSCTEVFADIVQQIEKGTSPQQLGEPITIIEEKYPFRSTVGPDWIDSQIIFIDQFENVVINLTKQEFEEHRKGRKFRIALPARNEGGIANISENYASVEQGERLAWFNSAGYLELAINKGNLAGLFGLKRFSGGTTLNSLPNNKLMYERVKIFFE
ncbi:MAG: SAM-dependent chlorinase/fluorinase [Bacteroidetes bacterium]|nr:SAM-dependent chlorinase/fluorinase [Bacteroidota bacterium]